MRMVVAGSSGFLGSALVNAWRDGGHDVVRLVRREVKSSDEVRWNPAAGELDPAALAGADAIVNMAGASVGPPHRLTDRYKQVAIASRVDTTATLANTAAALPPAGRPRMFLAQSGINYYGDNGDRPVTEEDPPGEGFLADLTRVWEAATRPAEDAGIRVVRLRTGIPLAKGGFLQPILWQFRLFAGGRLGSGRQYLPWISMTDWLRAATFAVEQELLTGPVNGVGPNPVTYTEFARTLGAIMHRPSFWVVPGVALRVALGEFGSESLASVRALPKALTEAGFTFEYPDLESALRAVFV